jgi:hypothetical protein
VGLALVAVPALVVWMPSASARTSLPPLNLAPTIARGDTQIITGRDCAGTSGLGFGYLVTILNGQLSLTGGDGLPTDGVWTYTTYWADQPAGRYEVAASCYDHGTEGDPYPPASFLLVPSADEEIDDVLGISTTEVTAGQTIDISAIGFSTFTNAGIFLEPGAIYLGSATPAEDEGGSLAATVTVPASVTAGSYSLFVQGWQNGLYGGDNLRTLAVGITVTGPPASSTTTTAEGTTTTAATGPLAVTGTRHAVPLTVLACVFLVVGAALVFAGNARARRHR